VTADLLRIIVLLINHLLVTSTTIPAPFADCGCPRRPRRRLATWSYGHEHLFACLILLHIDISIFDFVKAIRTMALCQTRLTLHLSHARPSCRPMPFLCDYRGRKCTASLKRRAMSSLGSPNVIFSEVPSAPVDPMFVLKQEYDLDPSPSKIDLGAGVLRNEKSACHEFSVVKEAKAELERRQLSHDVRFQYHHIWTDGHHS
jgi:hypothetical protein